MGEARLRLRDAKRIVIKVGTSTLTHESSGKLNLARIEHLIRELSDLMNQRREVVLVSSGAIAAGLGQMGLAEKPGTIPEKRAFLSRSHIALWDVLSSCEIHGAADSSIKNAVPNDFHELFERSKIHRVFCTGKTAFNLWQKHCAAEYEPRYNLTSECLPSTSPANAAWSMEQLITAYKPIADDSF